MASSQRKFHTLPVLVPVLFAVALCAQIVFHWQIQEPQANAEELPIPPAVSMLNFVSLSESTTFARILMLWLQAFDNQPGISIPFQDLNYDVVEAWLSTIIELDPGGQYPLLAASRLYAEVNMEQKQRKMLDFVARRFEEDPAKRWPWLAHAVVIAKHRIKDTKLALKYAQLLSVNSSVNGIPGWARQMEIFIREDMGEYQAAQILIGGLLSSGVVTDPYEKHFLQQRLDELANKEK